MPPLASAPNRHPTPATPSRPSKRSASSIASKRTSPPTLFANTASRPPTSPYTFVRTPSPHLTTPARSNISLISTFGSSTSLTQPSRLQSLTSKPKTNLTLNESASISFHVSSPLNQRATFRFSANGQDISSRLRKQDGRPLSQDSSRRKPPKVSA